jgi:UDP-N-acetylglucosamine--N-acetylmuramyl-(pentapeptide) pyrophosphoryl-undecaprenol N-acetylglucosamine transferase
MTSMKKNIALTGGGTGGHIFPLLSVYNFLKDDPEYSFIWVGEEGSLEEETAQKNKIHFFPISAWKVRRYFDIRNFYEPLKNMSWVAQGIQILLKNKIDIVFSKGGYVSIPLCIAAKILGKKIFVHESDRVTGISNKIISKLATKIFYTFPNSMIDGKKHIIIGQILNPEMIDYIEDVEVTENETLRVIVAWWSQGSTRIFEALINILPDFPEVEFQVILWEKNMHFREHFKVFPNVIAHDFVTQKRLGKIYKTIDIAISRGGATFLWELFYFWIHTIIIPLKNSAGNHQYYNAQYFHENYGSDILDEDVDLEVELFRLLKKYKDLRKSWLNLDDFFTPLNELKKFL